MALYDLTPGPLHLGLLYPYPQVPHQTNRVRWSEARKHDKPVVVTLRQVEEIAVQPIFQVTRPVFRGPNIHHTEEVKVSLYAGQLWRPSQPEYVKNSIAGDARTHSHGVDIIDPSKLSQIYERVKRFIFIGDTLHEMTAAPTWRIRERTTHKETSTGQKYDQTKTNIEIEWGTSSSYGDRAGTKPFPADQWYPAVEAAEALLNKYRRPTDPRLRVPVLGEIQILAPYQGMAITTVRPTEHRQAMERRWRDRVDARINADPEIIAARAALERLEVEQKESLRLAKESLQFLEAAKRAEEGPAMENFIYVADDHIL